MQRSLLLDRAKSIFFPMTSALQKTVSTLLLCFYIAGGALVELAHHDSPEGSSAREARFEHHDCGGADAHPAPEASHCLACSAAKHRFAIATHVHIPLQPVVALDGHIVRTIGQTLHTDVFHCGKRGPPRA